MYTARRLSDMKATRGAAQDGPGSGYLLVQEDDGEQDVDSCCFGCSAPRVRDLPFPQNKILTVEYRTGMGDDRRSYVETVLFVPVMNQPLSANRYYVVVAKGKHKGKVITCSKEEDMTRFLFIKKISDTKPKPFDHRDIYQQMEIIPHKGSFTAKSIAPDGFPPYTFRGKYWELYDKSTPISKPTYGKPSTNFYQIKNEDLGFPNTRRSQLPQLDIPTRRVVGKWYVPFFFVKEEMVLKDQMERAMFYEVILEQFYEKLHNRVERNRILFEGKDAMQQVNDSNDGYLWFKKTGNMNGERIGLSLPLWERVKWEETREGWIGGDEVMGLDANFGSFVLVERFMLKRMDGTLALVLDFIHENKITTK